MQKINESKIKERYRAYFMNTFHECLKSAQNSKLIRQEAYVNASDLHEFESKEKDYCMQVALLMCEKLTSHYFFFKEQLEMEAEAIEEELRQQSLKTEVKKE